MSKPFKTTISEGIAELVFDHPPVNAFDSKGWAAIAAEIEALGGNDDVNVIIIAAEGRGFCAGVDRAIKIVEMALEKWGSPVYVRHEIVHNKFVVDGLRARGAVLPVRHR